jgi:2,4-dienoyl-CoA reductase-like NADH-dependent reductase (Old Yellow Enzyme family)
MFDNLFEPLQLASVEIPNRIARAAHGAGFRWVDEADDLIAYHEARARGGVGLAIQAWGGVHPSSANKPGMRPMPGGAFPFYEREIIPGSRRLTDAVHRHGSKIFLQLVHRGSQAVNPLGGPPLSPSEVASPILGQVPVRLSLDLIGEIVDGYADAAANAIEGGFDGIEVQAGHGYLIGQFLSPATNDRDDRYGGDGEGRVRVLVEILEAVRARIGPGWPLGVRLSADDYVPEGLDVAETTRIVAAIESQIDYLDLSLGSYYAYHKFAATMDEPLGYELPTTTQVTRMCSKPSMVTGRILTLDHASEIVASGQAELVSMVRALLADPDLVNKARHGQDHLVRPCTGTAQGCMGRSAVSGQLTCVVNPAVGRELTMSFEPPPTARPRRLLVVGGGPAGLEAARTAALMGHEVELHELTDALGGQARIAAAAPRRSDFAAIAYWLAEELERLGVTVRLRSFVDVDVALAAKPDAVVVATGSLPRRDGFQVRRPGIPIPGSDLPHVYTSWDVFGFGGRASIGRQAVVFDDIGRYDALSVADALVEAGAGTTLVTSLDRMGARVDYPDATVATVRQRLLGSGVTFLPVCEIERITPEVVTVVPTGTTRHIDLPADTVVLVGYNTSEHGLADALVDAGVEVHIVGDAAGGRTMLEALHGAAAVVRAI